MLIGAALAALYFGIMYGIKEAACQNGWLPLDPPGRRC